MKHHCRNLLATACLHPTGPAADSPRSTFPVSSGSSSHKADDSATFDQYNQMLKSLLAEHFRLMSRRRITTHGSSMPGLASQLSSIHWKSNSA